MKTITVSNIQLLFDTNESGNARTQAIKFIDFLNEVLTQLKLPDHPQIMVFADELEVKEEDWESNGWK